MKTLKRGVTPGPFIKSVFLDRTRIFDPTHYAFNLPSLKNFSKLELHPRVTFFVGENGSGKSTMLEAIAIANGLNAEGGSRNMMFATRESHSKLHMALKLRRFHALVPDAWFVRAESLFNAQIYSFSEAGIVPIAYQDTEHYRVTKSFLDNPERMLGHLLGNEAKDQ